MGFQRVLQNEMKTFGGGGQFKGGRCISLRFARLCWTFAFRVSSSVLHLFLIGFFHFEQSVETPNSLRTLFTVLNNALCTF